MKIYFGFTVAGDRSAIDTARMIVTKVSLLITGNTHTDCTLVRYETAKDS
jgi:hypothetical protein